MFLRRNLSRLGRAANLLRVMVALLLCVSNAAAFRLYLVLDSNAHSVLKVV